MNKEIETLINNLEGCVGMFDYMLTPIENDLLLSYINELQQENKELHNKIDKAIKRIELLGKFDGEHCTRNFKMMSADFNYLLEILKDSDADE